MVQTDIGVKTKDTFNRALLMRLEPQVKTLWFGRRIEASHLFINTLHTCVWSVCVCVSVLHQLENYSDMHCLPLLMISYLCPWRRNKMICTLLETAFCVRPVFCKFHILYRKLLHQFVLIHNSGNKSRKREETGLDCKCTFFFVHLGE